MNMDNECSRCVNETVHIPLLFFHNNNSCEYFNECPDTQYSVCNKDENKLDSAFGRGLFTDENVYENVK